MFKKCAAYVVLARVVRNGETFSSALFFVSHGIVTYYLSARNLDHPKVPAGNALLSKTVEWAKNNGYSWFNFGGGHTLGDDDPLFKFKKNFTRNTVPFYIGKRVYDEELYAELARRYVEEKGAEKYAERKNLLHFYR